MKTIFVVEAINTVTHARCALIGFKNEEDAKKHAKEEKQKHAQQRRWIELLEQEEGIHTADLLQDEDLHNKTCESFFKKHNVPQECHKDLTHKSWLNWGAEEEREFVVQPLEFCE